MYVDTYIHIYMYIYICMYGYIYMYTHTHTDRSCVRRRLVIASGQASTLDAECAKARFAPWEGAHTLGTDGPSQEGSYQRDLVYTTIY